MVPAAHGNDEHWPTERLGTKSPAPLQPTQSVAGLESWSMVPASHGRHVPEEPWPIYVPVEHAVQPCALALMSLQPAGQMYPEHGPASPWDETPYPAGHCTQAVLPLESWSTLPRGHSPHVRSAKAVPATVISLPVAHTR
jgi:hypothetical protein